MENTSQMPDTENWFLLWKYIFARSCKLIFVICIFSVYIFIIKSKTFNVTFFACSDLASAWKNLSFEIQLYHTWSCWTFWAYTIFANLFISSKRKPVFFQHWHYCYLMLWLPFATLYYMWENKNNSLFCYNFHFYHPAHDIVFNNRQSHNIYSKMFILNSSLNKSQYAKFESCVYIRCWS